MGCNEEFMGGNLCSTAFTIVQLTLFDASFSAIFFVFFVFFMNELYCVLRCLRIVGLPRATCQPAIFHRGAHFLAGIKKRCVIFERFLMTKQTKSSIHLPAICLISEIYRPNWTRYHPAAGHHHLSRFLRSIDKSRFLRFNTIKKKVRKTLSEKYSTVLPK